MDTFFSFLEFLMWIFQWTFFGFGMLIGITGTVTLSPVLYRLNRRYVLRRRWRRDAPMEYTEPLVPEWRPYEPDAVGVDKRCVCHNRRIHPGERVLMWPETGPMDVLHVAVYCENSQERIFDAPHA
jgi:hypothetical protein